MPCVEPLPRYRPRDPRVSDLWRLMDRHFELGALITHDAVEGCLSIDMDQITLTPSDTVMELAV
jgi:hypothetical protein